MDMKVMYNIIIYLKNICVNDYMFLIHVLQVLSKLPTVRSRPMWIFSNFKIALFESYKLKFDLKMFHFFRLKKKRRM